MSLLETLEPTDPDVQNLMQEDDSARSSIMVSKEEKKGGTRECSLLSPSFAHLAPLIACS